jgi:tetratricopeptide (TPR) repeat protein
MWKVDLTAATDQAAEEARATGRDAADRAVAIDGKNSEALYIKAMLVDRQDWITRENLFKRALAARRLDCGCEHHQYGWLLVSVGRIGEGLEELHRANDMLALYVYTPLTLANALVVAGKPDEARQYFDAAIDLAPNADFADRLTSNKAMQIGDLGLLGDARLPIAADLRAALVNGYRALASRDAGAKAQAVQALLALPEDQQQTAVAVLLGALGANHEAFVIAARSTNGRFPDPSIFWYPGMRGTLDDPGFPAVATRLNLMKYWKTMRVRPDVCNEASPPAFCRTI